MTYIVYLDLLEIHQKHKMMVWVTFPDRKSDNECESKLWKGKVIDKMREKDTL
jgi:hypothetical protein